MASPSIAATNTSATAAAGTSLTVNLPASIASGDLLLVFIGQQVGTNAVFSATGWTQLYSALNLTITDGMLYRVADGSEGATVTVTSTQSGKAAHASYRITGSDTSKAPVASAQSGDATAHPDTLTVTPAGGSADYLFISCFASDGVPTVTAWPTNYTLGQLNPLSGGSGGSGSKATLGVSARQLTASSDNPGLYTISAAANNDGHTVAVYPAAAVATGIPSLVMAPPRPA
jgi:hypothetical protein